MQLQKEKIVLEETKSVLENQNRSLQEKLSEEQKRNNKLKKNSIKLETALNKVTSECAKFVQKNNSDKALNEKLNAKISKLEEYNRKLQKDLDKLSVTLQSKIDAAEKKQKDSYLNILTLTQKQQELRISKANLETNNIELLKKNKLLAEKLNCTKNELAKQEKFLLKNQTIASDLRQQNKLLKERLDFSLKKQLKAILTLWHQLQYAITGLYSSDEMAFSNRQNEPPKRAQLNSKGRYKIAAKAEKDGAIELATVLYKKLLQQDPNNITLHYKVGNLLLQSGQIKQATKFLEFAYKHRPENYNILTTYLKLLNSTNNYKKVINILTKNEAIASQHLELLQIWAEALLKIESYQDAVKKVNLALQQTPNNSQLLLLAANIALKSGNKSKAKELYQKSKSFGGKAQKELEKLLANNEQQQMTQFLETAAHEAEKNKDWETCRWYFIELMTKKVNPDFYRSKLALLELLDNNPKQALKVAKQVTSNQFTKNFIDFTQAVVMENYTQTKAIISEFKKNKSNASVCQISHLLQANIEKYLNCKDLNKKQKTSLKELKECLPN